jgi:hypothetical protein
VDEAERREIFAALMPELGQHDDFETWIAESPLVEVELE